jgi:putative phosphoesterase
MKYFVASDIHGYPDVCRKVLEAYDRENCDRLVLLGDLLYFGPRNPLGDTYDPKGVIALLNARKNDLLCVRGNCDSDVDQMVLDFPVMAEYCLLPLREKMIFATHGHVFHEDHLPPLKRGDILLHGHTHLYTAEDRGDYILLNPGSVSIPKGGNAPTYAMLTGSLFEILDFDGNVLSSMLLEDPA